MSVNVVTPCSSRNHNKSSKRKSSDKENSQPKRKKKLPLTASMPGPCMPLDLNQGSINCEPSSEDIVEHFNISEYDDFTTPFVTSAGIAIVPSKCIGHVKVLKIRNRSGSLSFSTFKVYFSSSTKPISSTDQGEIQEYDDMDTSVYYSDYKMPKTLLPHAHYLGHVIHHKQGDGSPESEVDTRSCWVRVICSYCKIEDPAIQGTSVVDMRHTGNNDKFRRHLLKYHPDVPMEVSYQTIASRLHSSEFKQLLSALMRLVVYDRLPFSFVSSPHFVALCRLLNPAVKIPSSTQFVSLLAIFIQDYLRNFTSIIPIKGFPANPNKKVVGGSVLMDAWESHAGNHLLCIQFQYCDALYQKRARVLGLKEICGPADASTICSMANASLETHGLQKHFYFTMSDSGSNIVCAFKHVTKQRWFPLAAEASTNFESTSGDDSVFNLNAPDLDPSNVSEYMQPTPGPTVAYLHCQFRCNSHLCNLIVGSSINDKERSKELKAWFLQVMATLTCVRRRHHLQEQLRHAIGRGARPYIEVRWNTVHDALDILTTIEGFTTVQSLINQARQESKTKKELEKIPDNLVRDDFPMIQEMYRILNCLARPCDILQSDFASAPDVLAQFALAFKALTCIRPTTTLMKKFRDTVMKQFVIRVKPLFQCSTLIAATILQPSQKHLFRWMHRALPDNPLKAPTPNEARDLLDKLVDSMTSDVDTVEDVGLNFESVITSGSTVDQYFAENVGKQTFQEFWLAKRRQYPKLAKLARIFDGLPASTGKVERTFSLLGLVQGDRRVALSADRLENLLLFAQADKGEDEIIPCKIVQTDKDSNFNALHSCSYISLIQTGIFDYKPLLVLPDA